jgi:hypothetical protein
LPQQDHFLGKFLAGTLIRKSRWRLWQNKLLIGATHNTVIAACPDWRSSPGWLFPFDPATRRVFFIHPPAVAWLTARLTVISLIL